MSAILAAALAVGVIAACIGPLYYWPRSSQGRGRVKTEIDDSETESPLVHIKISRPRCEEFGNDRGNSVDLDDGTERRQILGDKIEETETQIVPLKPPRRRYRRSSRTIWSSALRDQLENINNTSSEASGPARLMRAQVEVHQKVSLSNNNETSDFLRCESPRCENVDSTKFTSDDGYLTDAKPRRIPWIAAKRWKHLKKTFISRSDKSLSSKNTTNDETQRLSIPVPVSCRRSPVGHSTMLQKNQLVNASTSTKINANVSDTKSQRIENNEPNSVDSNRSDNCRRNSTLGPSPDVVSLTNRRAVDGKLICDVNITGLAMDQSELLDLFEATGGKTHSTSILTTEEASVICIKFRRHGRSHPGLHRRDTTSLEGPLKQFYRTLSETFEGVTLSKLFGFDESMKKSGCPPEVVPTSQYLRTDGSINDTSYIKCPKMDNRYTDNSLFDVLKKFAREI